MKKILLLMVIITSCSDRTETDLQSFSTVDSNVLAVGDSIPAILHIDTTAGSDTAFDVAMDSVGRIITAKDTAQK